MRRLISLLLVLGLLFAACAGVPAETAEEAGLPEAAAEEADSVTRMFCGLETKLK